MSVKMQKKVVLSHGTAALCVVLMVLVQQVCAGPLAAQMESSSDRDSHSRREHGVGTLRRAARMTPLWRIMNSKPFGAYCQNNYECSTGLCRAGHCSTSHRSLSEPVNY